MKSENKKAKTNQPIKQQTETRLGFFSCCYGNILTKAEYEIKDNLALSSRLKFIKTRKLSSRSLGKLVTFHSHSRAEQTGLIHACSAQLASSYAV